ncbi:MAG: hypothetical protein K5786_04595 [Treponema sp.]|nr:hypothetical protein [Treponema sp.]
MKSIITNTVKITAAAVLAILCAQALKLDFAVSAGIVAILSVQPTKKETLRTALARLLAFAVALVISIILFNLLGFTVPVFFLYLLLFILVCQWRKWISAMAMDSVLISHFLSFGKTGTAEIKNEVLLFVLGVGFGILVNLLLRKKTDYIEELKNHTDNQIKIALHRMALRIQNPALADYDGSCFTSLNQSLFIAKKQAEENYNNQFSKKDTFDSRYLEMREKQTKVLYEMFKAASDLGSVPSTAGLLSDFLEKVSNEYHKDNDVKSLIDELSRIHDKMKNVPLPQTRTEFESRANLFTLMERLKEFLQIKRNFMLSISDGTNEYR